MLKLVLSGKLVLKAIDVRMLVILLLVAGDLLRHFVK